MDYSARIISQRRVLDEFLKIDEVVFRRDGSNERSHGDQRHFIMERGDSVAGLVHDVERDTIVLARQFRIAVFCRRSPLRSDGALIEIPAGSIDDGETPEASLRREVLEEIGYQAPNVEPIMTVYSSPGGTTERVHLFYVPVTPADLVDPSASGIGSEHIERLEMPAANFVEACVSGELEDATTVIAGLWFNARTQSSPS